MFHNNNEHIIYIHIFSNSALGPLKPKDERIGILISWAIFSAGIPYFPTEQVCQCSHRRLLQRDSGMWWPIPIVSITLVMGGKAHLQGLFPG